MELGHPPDIPGPRPFSIGARYIDRSGGAEHGTGVIRNLGVQQPSCLSDPVIELGCDDRDSGIRRTRRR